jgi:CheY-like chemotaxis protein
VRARDGAARAGSGSATPAPQVELAVTDNGVGIEEPLRERIFEPFFSTKPRGQGTGLGLSIVHGIVSRLGGQIEVHSRLNQGSRFEVRLPRAELAPAAGAIEDPLAAARAAPRVHASPGAPVPGRHVLLVDDDEVVGLALEAYLQRAGFVPHRHTLPPAALEQLQSGSPLFDLVLTDHSMPGMTGVELARQITRQTPALPMVLMSGYVDDGLQAEALAAGVRAVVRKERIYDDLLPLLDRLLAPAG